MKKNRSHLSQYLLSSNLSRWKTYKTYFLKLTLNLTPTLKVTRPVIYVILRLWFSLKQFLSLEHKLLSGSTTSCLLINCGISNFHISYMWKNVHFSTQCSWYNFIISWKNMSTKSPFDLQVTDLSRIPIWLR